MFELDCENRHRPRALIFALLSIQGVLNIRCKYPLVWLFLEFWTSRRDKNFSIPHLSKLALQHKPPTLVVDQLICIDAKSSIPVVPHKAVAEVSKIGNL
jgi:hypothetical protein